MTDPSRRLDIGVIVGIAGTAASIVAVFQQNDGLKLGGALVGGVIVVTAVALGARRQIFNGSRLSKKHQELFSEYHRTITGDFLKELPLPSSNKSSGLAAQIRAKSAYIPVPYKGYASSFSNHLARRELSEHPDDPVRLLLTLSRAGESALILGAPGSGKTLAGALAFATLADEFKSSHGKSAIPILLRLSTITISEGSSSSSMSLADFLPRALRGKFEPEQLDRLMEAGNVRLILDGLDELPSGISSRRAPTPMPEELAFLLSFPTITTCREAFHSLYVDADRIATSLGTEIELRPLTYEGQAVPFVNEYCAALGTPDLVQPILRILDFNHSLADTLSRPLMLRMVVDVFHYELANGNAKDAERLLLTGSDYLNARIYEQYVMTWLKREQRKQNRPVLLPFQKLNLIELIAWQIFCNPGKTDAGYGSFELFDLTIGRRDLAAVVGGWVLDESRPNAPIDRTEVLEEVAERTFLIVGERGDLYRFAHKSFFEYFVAQYVYNHLADSSTTETDLVTLLNRPFPDEVVDFLRELLHFSKTSHEDPTRRQAVAQALLSVVREEAGRQTSLMARQQAANLLPIVATHSIQSYLVDVVTSDDHPFIRRAIAVGEALHHQDSRYMDLFVDSLDTDERARSFHMGYNRIYYGDQPLSSTDFEDDGRVACSRFFRACLRHLTLDRYKDIRSMALATIRIMLDDADRQSFLVDHEYAGLQQVREICRQAHPELGLVYERERKSLEERLDNVLRRGADESGEVVPSVANSYIAQTGADVVNCPGPTGDEDGRNPAQVD